MKSRRTQRLSARSNARGGALVTTIILCAIALVLVGSYLQSLSVQARIDNRATLTNEARSAAEGVAEYALAEMDRRSSANPSFGAGTNPNPLSGFSLSSANLSFLAPGTSNSHVVSSSIEFKNSALSNQVDHAVAISASDPVNADDSTCSQTLKSVRTMNIFAKASVLDPVSNKPITSYVSEEIQVRDETWLNYAIFYNMDLEFHAGPDFTIYGPVMCNANVYATAGAGNELDFFSNLSAYKNIYRYDKYSGDTTSYGHTGTVKCITKSGMYSGDLLSMSAAPSAQDSTDPNFLVNAGSRWKKFVKDHTFGVALFNPPGMQPYVPENYATTSVVEMRNNAYLMIEPQLGTVPTHNDPYTGINDFGNKGNLEDIKFSGLSGFVIQVLPPNLTGTTADYVDTAVTPHVYYHHEPQWQMVCYQATDPSQRLSADNPPARDSTTGLPATPFVCTINPFTDPDDVDYPTTGATIKRSLKIALLNAIIAIPYKDGGTSTTVWGNGTSALAQYTPTAPLNIATGAAPAGATAFNTALNISGYYPIYDQREAHDYTTSGGDVTTAMKGAMHVIKIDFAKLNTLLQDTSGVWQKPYSSAAYVYNPATNFTGVVYVQFPLKVPDAAILQRFPAGDAFNGTGGADGDRVRPAQAANPSVAAKTPGYAVLAANAGTVPHLTGSTPPDGFTLATNGPLYVWGHYNADGNSGTGSATTPDSTSELPAMLAADAITALSSTFNFANMATSVDPSTNAFTEISASIITGLVPTQPGKDQIWAGGVHNLVRLLENWNSTYRYRGSIAVLFECEVAKGGYHENHNPFYDPPTREIGYHQYLGQGRFPPATPINRTVRRMNLQDITAATYNAGPSTPPAYNDSTTPSS